ncbi:FMN reductase (NADH) NtaB [Aquimixticola soesokkakensis]|uniref:FMN reductase (NADH) NtaB n=1 Tax=Aquimixticola soesokkakensis TaxID=1519096 RepID=A0A1Y5T6F9_9RHOB|nr:flavin reductase family protein [Aquimixticola soesokkakensis]SLN56936.1 FMN reductase (NADH) NtaB [Aquimixticola soesokkakensis]
MSMQATGDDVDMGKFWRTLGERPIGATLVTTDSAEGPNGFLGLSAAHVSANPPTMLVSIDKKTSALAGVLDKGHFAVNYLPEGCAELANMFGGKGDKLFEQDAWDTLATGAPVFKDALGVFDCEVEKVVEHGDISIVIGRVKGVRAKGEGAPLTFFRGKFQSQ